VPSAEHAPRRKNLRSGLLLRLPHFRRFVSKYGWETALVLSVFLGSFFFFAKYGGGPTGWDELLYMDLSLNPAADPHILNRYFHIYFQRLFFLLAGDPLAGARIFWAFLISATGLVTYALARNLREGGGPVSGAVAVVLLFMQPLILRCTGVTYADFTLMFLMTVGVAVYLASWRTSRYRTALLVTFGALLFFSLRTKEVGICLAFLLIGFLRRENDRSRWSRLIMDGRWIAVGAGLGFLLFVVLNWWLLGDALFGVRASEYRTLAGFNFGPAQDRSAVSYLAIIFGWAMVIPWLLYLLNASRLGSNRPRVCELPVWWLPPVILGFLTVAMIGGRFGADGRYVVPALPVVCALAASSFGVTMPEARGGAHSPWVSVGRWFVAPAALGGAVLLAVYGAWRWHLQDLGWDQKSLFVVIVAPTAALILLALESAALKTKPLVAVCSLACILVVALPSVYREGTIVARGDAIRAVERRFYPLVAFSRFLSLSETTRVFVSAGVFEKYGMLARPLNRAEGCKWMFDVWFNRNFRADQFSYSDIPQRLFDGTFDYGLLTRSDWDGIITSAAPEQRPRVSPAQHEWRVESEPEGILVLVHH